MNTESYRKLKTAIDDMPVVDCHDHASKREKSDDILAFIAQGYFSSDLTSASGNREVEHMRDKSLPLEERWTVFEKAYRRTKHTGYGKAVRLALMELFGTDELTLPVVREMQKKLPDFSDPKSYDRWFEEARIVGRIADSWPSLKELKEGTFQPLPGQRLAIALPGMHGISTRLDIDGSEAIVGKTVTSLLDYLSLCREIFEIWKRNGAVCFKDQSAYRRSLAYGNPTFHEAESIFNKILADPRYHAEYDPDRNPLSDYLMHAFMRMAREMNLPVQIHTGHMAGIRNDVAKTNAKGLRSVLEIHREVRFDLFHLNWPYAGDLLFLAKNYPNVAIDCCWAHTIDPIYTRRFLAQAVSAVPHAKIHGFGSDVGGAEPHIAWASCRIAKENIARALTDLIEDDYLSLEEAEGIASDWLFGNPNEFFALGLKG
jgi:hypothetical protein